MMVAFRARDGQRMFAFFPLDSNPDAVLVELAWAWPNGQKCCDLKRCPRSEGGYCLECHMAASTARSLAEARLA